MPRRLRREHPGRRRERRLPERPQLERLTAVALVTSDWRTTIRPPSNAGLAYLNDAPPDDMVSRCAKPSPAAAPANCCELRTNCCGLRANCYCEPQTNYGLGD